MGKVQGQYCCSALPALEMNPHCLTVLILKTAIMTCILLVTMLSSIITICVTSTAMQAFIVQVPN